MNIQLHPPYSIERKNI